jgi:hypothetical protein
MAELRSRSGLIAGISRRRDSEVTPKRRGEPHFQAGVLEVPGLSLFFLDSRSPALLHRRSSWRTASRAGAREKLFITLAGYKQHNDDYDNHSDLGVLRPP